MNPAYIAAAGVWLVATGVWHSLGGFSVYGIAGFLCYLGVCLVGGTLCGRYI